MGILFDSVMLGCKSIKGTCKLVAKGIKKSVNLTTKQVKKIGGVCCYSINDLQRAINNDESFITAEVKNAKKIIEFEDFMITNGYYLRKEEEKGKIIRLFFQFKEQEYKNNTSINKNTNNENSSK
jgi:hypothetical protein